MQKEKNTTEVTLRLPPFLLEQVDECRKDLGMCRNTWLVRAVRRGLEFSRQHEQPVMALPMQVNN